jgi:hypothetical protein
VMQERTERRAQPASPSRSAPSPRPPGSHAPGSTPSPTSASWSAASVSGTSRPRHPRRSQAGSGQPPRHCCAASKQPRTASAHWKPTTGSYATPSNAHSASSAQRPCSHQPRHARKAPTQKKPAAARLAPGSPVKNTVRHAKQQVRNTIRCRARDKRGGLRPEPAVVRDHRAGLRTAGLDPTARPHRDRPPLGTETAPVAAVLRRLAPGPRRPPPAAPARPALALVRPPSPACVPSRPADQPEPSLRYGRSNPEARGTPPAGATAGQPATARTRKAPPAEPLRPGHQPRERSRLACNDK